MKYENISGFFNRLLHPNQRLISPTLILTRQKNSKEIIIDIIIMSSKKADKYKPKPARANATVRAVRARAEQRRLEGVEELAAAQRAEQRGTWTSFDTAPV